MKQHIALGALTTVIAFGGLWGCSKTETKSPDVSSQIRNSIDPAGLKDVSVSQDRDKGVVTLGGTTTSEGDKGQTESIAKSLRGRK